MAAHLWSNDEEIVKNVLYSFFYLSDTVENIQDIIIRTGCVSKIMEYLSIRKEDIQRPCLRIVGNLATGSVKLVENILDSNAIKILIELLNSSTTMTTITEILWVLTNISDSEVKIINRIASSARFHEVMIAFLDSTICVKVINFVKVSLNTV